MLYTINELREDAFRPVYQVYSIFQDFFGDNYVDLQGLPDDDNIASYLYYTLSVLPREDGVGYELSDSQRHRFQDYCASIESFILVYWPVVRVTNEYDKSITIRDLYAKVPLTARGFIPTEKAGFTLNRATYPLEQWVSEYMHSHISQIPKRDLTKFQSPCLGSGPIIATINYLREGINEGFDETRWMLFCQELSQYVTVESVAGVPYHRLEQVASCRLLYGYYGFDYQDTPSCSALHSFEHLEGVIKARDFISYYLKHGHFKLNYQNGKFTVGMSYFDYILDVSNAFIDLFNTTYAEDNKAQDKLDWCYRGGYIRKAIVSNGKFYSPNDNRETTDTSNYQGRKVCDFKGKEITLTILNGQEDTEIMESVVLSHHTAMAILYTILRTVNYHYTNEHNRKQELGSPSQPGQALPAPTHQAVYYL